VRQVLDPAIVAAARIEAGDRAAEAGRLPGTEFAKFLKFSACRLTAGSSRWKSPLTACERRDHKLFGWPLMVRLKKSGGISRAFGFCTRLSL
jgi:hypothetical protein